MTMKDHIFRILVLLVIAAAGFISVAFTINLLIYFGILNVENAPNNFLQTMALKATYVWMGAMVLGVISLFIRQKWRITLLLCPLILPALFTIVYTITQT